MLTEEDLKNININNYEGTRYQRFENGKLVEDLDTRNLFCEIKRRLEEYKILCNEEVLKKAPLYKQINVLAGRETISEADSVNIVINDYKDRYSVLKQRLLNCTSLDQLESIYWGSDEKK